MIEKVLLVLVALLPFLSGCFALFWPHKFDQYARDDSYSAVPGVFILRILPTSINVWFIRLLGVGCIYLACWLVYMMATRT